MTSIYFSWQMVLGNRNKTQRQNKHLEAPPTLTRWFLTIFGYFQDVKMPRELLAAGEKRGDSTKIFIISVLLVVFLSVKLKFFKGESVPQHGFLRFYFANTTWNIVILSRALKSPEN